MKLTGPQSITLFRIRNNHSCKHDGRVLRALRDFGFITLMPGEADHRLTSLGHNWLAQHGPVVRRPAPEKIKIDLVAGLEKVTRTKITESWILRTLKDMEFDLMNWRNGLVKTADSYNARSSTLTHYYHQNGGVLVSQGVRGYFSRWAPS